MDLSIVIAHYDPGNHPDCLLSFHKTLSALSDQKGDLDIEIIIGDDGSPSNEYIIQNFFCWFLERTGKIYLILKIILRGY